MYLWNSILETSQKSHLVYVFSQLSSKQDDVSWSET